jgi:hypothetical protein
LDTLDENSAQLEQFLAHLQNWLHQASLAHGGPTVPLTTE